MTVGTIRRYVPLENGRFDVLPFGEHRGKCLDERGVFIWRDPEDENLWCLVAQGLPPVESDSLIKASARIRTEGGFDSVNVQSGPLPGDGGLAIGDSVVLNSPDEIEFAFEGNDIVFVVGEGDDEVNVLSESGTLLKNWDITDFAFGEDRYVQPRRWRI